MKKYPKYRQSGVEWLGEVPGHWEVKKLSHLTNKIGSGKTPSGGATVYQDEGVLFVRSQNVYDDGLRLDDVVYISDEIDDDMACSRVKPSDVLLNITGASLGRTCIAPSDLARANVNQHVCIIRMCDATKAPFVALFLKSKVAKGFFENAQTGSAREGLNFEQIAAFRIPLPPLPEQQSIATYLDRETGRTDTLIDKKQRIVELLKEKRVAMVSRAVTKGLDPKVKMKPSGVEWLGEVPEHWEVKKLKHRAVIRYGIGEPPEYVVEGVPLIRATNVNAGKIESANLVRVDPSDIPGARIVWLKAGDIIVVRSGAYTGDSSIIPKAYENSIAGFDMVVSVRNTHSEFVAYALLSKYLKDGQIYLEKLRAAQPHLNAEELGNCTLLLPPLPEQQTISTYLDRETAKLDTLISKVDTAIDTLKEYRTALISAAVTGKICVTDGLGGMKDEHK